MTTTIPHPITPWQRAQLRRLAEQAQQAHMACAMEAEVLAGLCDLLDALEGALRNADRRLTRLGPAVTAAEGLYHACDWLAHTTSDAEADAACAEIDAAAAAVCEAVGALRTEGGC